MSGWRSMAEEALRRKDNRDNRDNTHPQAPENGASVPSVPTALAPLSALRLWRASLSALDLCQPPEGFTMGRWQTLCDTSFWWLEGFGRAAAMAGWSTSDVFGIYLPGSGCGGLIDRLGDNRSLIMDSEQARWRSWGVSKLFNRTGAGDLPALWEI